MIIRIILTFIFISICIRGNISITISNATTGVYWYYQSVVVVTSCVRNYGYIVVLVIPLVIVLIIALVIILIVALVIILIISLVIVLIIALVIIVVVYWDYISSVVCIAICWGRNYGNTVPSAPCWNHISTAILIVVVVYIRIWYYNWHGWLRSSTIVAIGV